MEGLYRHWKCQFGVVIQKYSDMSAIHLCIVIKPPKNGGYRERKGGGGKEDDITQVHIAVVR